MSTKILIANRGEPPQSGVAAKLDRPVHQAHAGDITPELPHV